MRIQNINTYNSYSNKFGFASCISYEREPEKLSERTRDMIEFIHGSNQELRDRGYNPLWFHAYFIPQKMGNDILEGISVFEGLNMTEVGFILTHLTEIGVLRGCFNNCAHCYASALPLKKNSEDYVARMSWEDYKDLTDGIKEINTRLDCITRYRKTPLILFHDSDSSQVYINDEEGNTHGCTELAKMMYDAANVPVILSTAGWYKNDKAAQERMEQYVKEIAEADNLDYLYSFHISINPYQAINHQVVQLNRAGKHDKAKFLHQKDVERMANVLFTMTPLINTGKLKFLSRAMSNESKNSEGYSEKDLRKLMADYFDGLEKLYEDDYNSEQKIIKTREDIALNLAKYRELFERDGIDTSELISTEGRLSSIYDKDDPMSVLTREMCLNNPKKASQAYYFGMIDANGDYYLTNYYETYKTDLKLNFKNKNKKTPPINPSLTSDPVTKEHIEAWEEYFSNELFIDVKDDDSSDCEYGHPE